MLLLLFLNMFFNVWVVVVAWHHSCNLLYTLRVIQFVYMWCIECCHVIWGEIVVNGYVHLLISFNSKSFQSRKREREVRYGYVYDKFNIQMENPEIFRIFLLLLEMSRGYVLAFFTWNENPLVCSMYDIDHIKN